MQRDSIVTYASCPTDVVNAPIEIVWGLLTDPEGWGDFYDVRITGVDPRGPASVGQRFKGESGPRFLHLKLSFVYTLVDAEQHRLGLDIQLPMGIRVQEDLECVRIGPDRCRVNYHCNFDFARGWRGWIVRRAMARELKSGPADSLVRLKRAAESRFRNGQMA